MPKRNDISRPSSGVMVETPVTLTVRWFVYDGELTYAAPEIKAAVAAALAESLKDHTETIAFGREITDAVRDNHRLEGTIEINRVTVKGPSPGSKGGARAPGSKAQVKRAAAEAKRKGARKRNPSDALKRALRGT